MHKILITGDTGFLGTNLKTRLDGQGLECRGLALSSSDISADITDYSVLKNIDFSPDVIVHTAANLNNNIINSFMINELGSLNICRLAKEKGARHIVFISTIFVYDNQANQYYGVYGLTKGNAEKIVQKFCEAEDINLTILRCAQIYDFEGAGRKAQPLLYGFIDNIIKNEKINIHGNQNPLRNYVDIDYVTGIITDVLTNQRTGTYNVINDTNYTLTDIANIIFEILNIPPNIKFIKDKEDIRSIYIPCDNIYLSDKKPLKLKDGISRIINYAKKQD